jgi:hypothetical protein
MTGDIKKLGGIVEVDETFVGCKDKDKVRDKHGSGGTAGVGSNKSPYRRGHQKYPGLKTP